MDIYTYKIIYIYITTYVYISSCCTTYVYIIDAVYHYVSQGFPANVAWQVERHAAFLAIRRSTDFRWPPVMWLLEL